MFERLRLFLLGLLVHVKPLATRYPNLAKVGVGRSNRLARSIVFPESGSKVIPILGSNALLNVARCPQIGVSLLPLWVAECRIRAAFRRDKAIFGLQFVHRTVGA